MAGDASRGQGGDRRDRSGSAGRSRWLSPRFLATVVVIVLLVWFALANRTRVQVNYLLFERSSRVIWVIVLSAIMGALADRLLIWRGRRRRHPDD